MTTEFDVNLPLQRKGRRTKAAQQAQWQFQAHLLDQLSDAVIAIDLDECITYLNRTAVVQYGVDPVSAIGQPLSHAYRYEWLQPEDELLADAALSQQGRWRGENRHIRQDGSTLHVESLVTVLRNEAGNAIGLLATIRDITDRKQVEQNLRASELRYRRLADTMPQLVWTANATGVVDYYNIHIHDFDPAVWQGAAGFDWESLLHPADLALTLTTWQQAVNQRQPYSCEHRLHMADGSWRWHLSRALLVQDPDQGFKWYGTATDIHERKLAEEQLKFHAGLLDYAYDAVIAIDADLNVTAWNRGAEAMYGWSAAEMVGRKPHEVLRSTMTPAARAEAMRQMAEDGRFRVEATTHHRDGTPILVEGHTVAMRDDNGQISGYMSISRDIRARKAVEEALRTSEERYRTLFETMDEGFCVFELLYNEAGEPVDYRFLEVNPAFALFTGLENAVGKTAYELVPNLEPRWVAIYDTVARTGEARHFIEGSAAMGRWFEVYAFRFGGPESRCVALLFTDITERKLTEDALRDSEEDLRYTIELNPQVPWTADPDGNIINFNQRWLALTGMTEEEVLGGWMQASHPNDRPAMVAAWRHAIQSGDPYDIEHRIRLADGSYRWMRSRAFPRRDKDGVIVRWYGATEDIHERKLVEEALRENEARLQTILQNVPVSVYLLTPDQRYLYVNRYYEELAGIANAEIQGKSIYDMFDPATATALAANDQRALAAKVPLVLEEFAPQHGEIHTYVSIKTPLLNADGEPYALLGISTDITEHKVIEEALRASEARLRQLADAMPQIVWQADADGINRYFNQRWLDYTGLTLAESLADANRAIHPDDQAEVSRLWQAVRPLGKPYESELRLRRADGAYRWHLARCMPIYNDEGQLLCWYGTSTDIDAGKRATEALRASEERLRLATEAGGVGIFDHDLNTDQTVISALYAQIIGLPPDTLVTREVWLSCVHPEDRPLVEGIWQAAQATGASYYYECRILRPDGALVWIEVNAWVTPDETGRGARITGAVRDITERKQTALHQQFLLDLNSALRGLTSADAVQEAVVARLGQYLGADRCRFNAIDLSADKSTLLAAWSRPGLPPPTDINPLSALAPAAYITSAQAGRTLVIQDATQDEQNEIIKALMLAHGFVATIRVPCLREGIWVASLHVLQTTPRQWRPDEVQLVESVVHHFWPLAEKARVEAELRRHEEFLRQIADNVPGLVGYLGADERYRFVNAAFERWFQQPRQQIIGHKVIELIGEQAHSQLADYRQRALTGETVTYETDFVYPDGVRRTVWGRHQPDVAADGSVLGFYLFLMDITARKQAEADQQLLADLAEQIRLADDAATLVAAAVWLVGDHLQVGRCLWIEVDEAQQRGFIQAQHCRGLPPVAVEYTQTDYSPSTRAELTAGRVLVNYDAQSDPRTAAFYETIYAPQQERAYVGVPVLREGLWRGLLSVTVAEARQWQPREIHLLETVAEQVWLAVEKLRLHAEVRQANERFTLAEAAVPGWIYDYDWRTGQVTRSDGFQRVLGYTLEECQPTAAWWQSLMHPDDWQWLAQETGPSIPPGDLRLLEYRVRDRNGHYHHIWDRARVIRDESGAVIRLVGSSVDISERKAAEEALRLSEARFRHLAEAMPQIVWTCQADGSMTYINQRWEQYSGLTPATTLTEGMWPAIHPADQAANREQWGQALASGAAYQGEIRLRRHDGAYCWFLERAIPVRDEAGAITQWFGVSMDIDERKRQERHQQFLSELGMDLRLLSDTETILTQLVKRLGAYLQVAGCRVNEVDLQREQFTLLKDWVADDAPWLQVATPGSYPFTELAPPALLVALQAGQTVAIANTLQDSRTAPVATHYEYDQVHSLIGVPIFHQGQWRATLSVKGHGERHWLPDEVTLLEAVAGQLSALLEKVHAEEALRASEERLRLALAGGGMGIWESQIATNHSIWSPEMYALFDLAPDLEITDELFNRLVHPDDLVGLQTALNNLITSGSECEYNGEFRIIRPDGEVRWLADRVTVIRDETDQPVRLLGINFDITERKEREAMIRQQLAEIEAIYATAPVGLCLVDRDLRYMRINETLALINGSTIAEQLGRSLAETQPAEGYRVIEPLYRRVIETGIPLLNQEVHESHVDPAQARDWLASYYPLKNGDGVVTGVNAVILEITERKRYERQLEELNASLEKRVGERTKALEQANRALSITNRELEQFTYAAAHDLRTPLRGIANLVQWISEDAAPVLPLASQRHLDKLSGRVKRLEKMLEDLLVYSRVGRVRYQPEMVDVQQMVQSLIDLLSPPVGFVIKSTTELPTFAALRVPLELVFRNLLSNAIRHHHEPDHGQAVIAARDLGDWYEFCVSDNGPGIDRQYHERIFGMFQTLKPRDQVDGSGIGLALIKKTVESIGGRIWMESALGQGTSFYFTWPKEQKTEGRRQRIEDRG